MFTFWEVALQHSVVVSGHAGTTDVNVRQNQSYGGLGLNVAAWHPIRVDIYVRFGPLQYPNGKNCQMSKLSSRYGYN